MALCWRWKVKLSRRMGVSLFFSLMRSCGNGGGEKLRRVLGAALMALCVCLVVVIHSKFIVMSVVSVAASERL